MNLCQSAYALAYLNQMGINDNRIEYLSDYVNDIYTEEIPRLYTHNNTRKDVVLYNPKKGYKFTKKLIACSPDLKWIPLINLNSKEIKQLLLTSKVYVDFGNHPGKDRFPREAAACGCCIITGMRGSAAYKEDVNIPKEFKFNEKKVSKKVIVGMIRQCIARYEERTCEFDDYREAISCEKESFIRDVGRLFPAKQPVSAS